MRRNYRSGGDIWRWCGLLKSLLILGFLLIEPGRLPPAYFLQFSVGLRRWYVKWIPPIFALVVTLDRVDEAYTEENDRSKDNQADPPWRTVVALAAASATSSRGAAEASTATASTPLEHPAWQEPHAFIFATI